ncbi:MAG: hypothetical protein K5656_00465, partial [Lachnospiraceae bacterium]|nr:hypothetical protein [Lachnospiraceae bacterium]
MVYNNRINISRRLIAGALLLSLLAFMSIMIAKFAHADATQCSLTMTVGGDTTSYNLDSVTAAIASANASADANTTSVIKINSSDVCVLTETQTITKNITINKGSAAGTIKRMSAFTMFRVEQGATLRFEDITVDGNNQSGNIVYVAGGNFVLDGSTSKITGCANTNTAVPTNVASATGGPGTIFVGSVSNGEGSFTMSEGTII